jgi:hypothetical protein
MENKTLGELINEFERQGYVVDIIDKEANFNELSQCSYEKDGKVYIREYNVCGCAAAIAHKP